MLTPEQIEEGERLLARGQAALELNAERRAEYLTREEAIGILQLYRNWNEGQKSLSLASGGPRTREDDVYDARRALLIQATELLAVSAALSVRGVVVIAEGAQ